MPSNMIRTGGPSPTFLGDPRVCMPCSSTPVGSDTPDRLRRSDAAFRTVRTTSAPTNSPLSRLDHTACTLAVYASQCRLPVHHARLASGCRSTLPGRIGYLPGPGERFHAVIKDPCRNPRFPGFPWRTHISDRSASYDRGGRTHNAHSQRRKEPIPIGSRCRTAGQHHGHAITHRYGCSIPNPPQRQTVRTVAPAWALAPDMPTQA